MVALRSVLFVRVILGGFVVPKLLPPSKRREYPLVLGTELFSVLTLEVTHRVLSPMRNEIRVAPEPIKPAGAALVGHHTLNMSLCQHRFREK